jgi:1-phosphatidylinositol phosphodiesterase
MKHFSRSNVRRMVRLVGMVLLGMVCLTPGAQIARAESSGPRYYNDESSISTSHTDWMTWVPDDFSLAQMSIPGTHDTMTYNLPAYTAAWTQNLSLKTQLEAGIRAIDIRAKHENDTFELVHDKVDLDMEFRRDVLILIDEFLKAHPKETILMRLKEEAQNEAVGNTRSFVQTFKAYRDDPNYTSYFWKPSSSDPKIPELKDVRGKIVLLQDFKPIGGEGYGLPWGGSRMDIQDNYTVINSEDKYNSPSPRSSTTHRIMSLTASHRSALHPRTRRTRLASCTSTTRVLQESCLIIWREELLLFKHAVSTTTPSNSFSRGAPSGEPASS